MDVLLVAVCLVVAACALGWLLILETEIEDLHRKLREAARDTDTALSTCARLTAALDKQRIATETRFASIARLLTQIHAALNELREKPSSADAELLRQSPPPVLAEKADFSVAESVAENDAEKWGENPAKSPPLLAPLGGGERVIFRNGDGGGKSADIVDTIHAVPQA